METFIGKLPCVTEKRDTSFAIIILLRVKHLVSMTFSLRDFAVEYPGLDSHIAV